jgi:hypothetical protein
MSSGRKLGCIATADTVGEGGDKGGFRLQPGSSRIRPIIASRRSRIFKRRFLRVNIRLYSRNDRESSYRRILVKKRLAGNGACDLTTSIPSVNCATSKNSARSFTKMASLWVPIALHQRDRTIRITVAGVVRTFGTRRPANAMRPIGKLPPGYTGRFFVRTSSLLVPHGALTPQARTPRPEVIAVP